MDSDKTFETLSRCRLFQELGDEDLRKVAAIGELLFFPPGEVLYEQDELSTTLFIVVKGRVALVRNYSIDEKRAASVTAFVANSGTHREVIGCWCSLVGEQQRQMCTAVCRKPTEVIAIPCVELRRLLVEDPRLGMHVIEKLVLTLRERIEFSYGVMETL